MEILGIHASFAVIVTLGFMILLAGFWLIERSKDKQARDRHKTWSPDVDRKKAESMQNHGPGGGQ